MADFPEIKDGDVRLVVCKKLYKLQSSFLRAQSALFNDLLSDSVPHLIPKARAQSTIRYVLALAPTTTSSGIVTYNFQRVMINRKGEVDQISFDAERKYVSREMPICRYLNIVLTAMHNKTPTLDMTSMKTIKDDVAGVLSCARAIGAVPAISARIETLLLSKGQSLFLAISQEPVHWLHIAIWLCSRPIYKEALIHLVGRYKSVMQASSTLGYHNLSPSVQDLVGRKHESIQKRCVDLCERIATYCPSEVQHKPTLGIPFTDATHRKKFGNDMNWHLAIRFFRQWYFVQINRGVLYKSPDSGWAFIKKIHDGGEAYLTRQDCEHFPEMTQLSQKARQTIYRMIFITKDHARRWARTLMKSKAELDSKTFARGTAGHFTCTEVEDADYLFDDSRYVPGRVTGEGLWVEQQVKTQGIDDNDNDWDDEEDDITLSMLGTNWRNVAAGANDSLSAPGISDSESYACEREEGVSDFSDDSDSGNEASSDRLEQANSGAVMVDLMQIDNEDDSEHDSDVEIVAVNPRSVKQDYYGPY